MKKTFLFCLPFAIFCFILNAADRNGVGRVVSLAPSITEIIYFIGAGSKLVGRTSACDYPPAVTNVPVVGSFGRPAIEKVVSLKPDIVLVVELEDKTLYDYMEKLGLKVAKVKCKTLDDIAQSIMQIGELIGEKENADQLAEKLTKELEFIKKENSTFRNKPRVYVEIWNDPMTTVGKNSFVNELITMAGGSNIAGNIENDYFTVSSEWIIKENPDVILCLYMSQKADIDFIKERGNGWGYIEAVKNKRIFNDFDNSTILRPSPRVVEGILSLRKKFYPEK